MITRTLTIACAVAGLSGLVAAQTINMPSANFSSYIGNTNWPGTGAPSGGTNTVVTANVTSGYVLTNAVNIVSANITPIDPLSWQNEPSVALSNSAHPGLFTYFRFTDTGGTYTTLSVSGVTRPLDRSTFTDYTWGTDATLLAGVNIPSGSVWTCEAYEQYDDSTTGADASGSVTFTLPGTAILDVPAQVLSFTGTLPAYHFYLDTALNGSFTAAATSNPTLKDHVVFNGEWAGVVAGTWGDDMFIIIENNGFPGSYAYFQPFEGETTTVAPAVNKDITLFGPLVGAAISTGSIYRVEVSDEYNDDGLVDTQESSLINPSIQLFSSTPLGPSNQTLSGTLALGDTVGAFAFNRNIAYEVKQGVTTIASGTLTVSANSSALSISVPASYTGGASLILDGSSFLKRIVAVNLTGSNQAIGTATMQNGDVNNTGEVDAA
ncbi:MAG: hypothetical protein JNK63_10865, partial [Chthonomonas sp.]|nr:hypothetical protein [Chthonomonas sp.]